VVKKTIILLARFGYFTYFVRFNYSDVLSCCVENVH